MYVCVYIYIYTHVYIYIYGRVVGVARMIELKIGQKIFKDRIIK